MDILFGLLFLLGFLALYFLPFAIAVHRKHKNRVPIFLVNLIFGMTLLGWGIALIWAFTANTESA